MRPFVIVDVEADGPIPGKYSMVSFGAVLYADRSKTFYGKVMPISYNYIPSALAVSGHTREEHLGFDTPENVMQAFYDWVIANSVEGQRPIFVSDNPAFDWQWINYYFHMYLGKNPFGFSARRIGDIWSGSQGDMRDTSGWRRFRKTRHTHNPVDDALGVAEALEYIIKRVMDK